jgi:CheY-like chemotaxis protein
VPHWSARPPTRAPKCRHWSPASKLRPRQGPGLGRRQDRGGQQTRAPAVVTAMADFYDSLKPEQQAKLRELHGQGPALAGDAPTMPGRCATMPAMHHILLIDDDAQLGPPLAAYLQRFELPAGPRRTTPSAGLALWRPAAFDAVILDVMLPEMDGFERLPAPSARARRTGAMCRSLMLTARGELMRPGGGAGAGRRRLPAQAVRAARAGRAAADHPAPCPARRAGGGRRCCSSTACRSTWRAGRWSAWAAGGADQHRVRAAAPAGAGPQQGVQTATTS